MWNKQSESQEGRNIQQETLLLQAIDEKAYREALAQLVTVHDLPLSFAEYPALGALIHSVNYMAAPVVQTSRKAVPNIIRQAYILHQSKVRDKLDNALSKIHLTIDMWSAGNHSAFQVITAHFVDSEKLQLQKALLSLKELKGSHGAKEQAPHLLTCLENYQIDSTKLGYVVSDNHGSNDKLLQLASKKLPGFDPVERRIRCNGHIINLAAQAFLFGQDNRAEAEAEAINNINELSRAEKRGDDQIQTAEQWRKLGVLGKLHNINMDIRSSTTRYQAFVKSAGRSIPRDNKTRWNSWYQQLHVALKPEVRKAILEYQDSYYLDVKADVIDLEAWNELKEMHDLLQPFYDVTQDTQSDRSTLDRVLINMDYLVRHFQKASTENRHNKTLSTRIITSWNKFDKYYTKTDRHAIYAAAILLHPALRKGYLSSPDEGNWKQSDIDKAVKRVRTLWQKEYKQSGIVMVDEEENPQKAWIKKIYGSLMQRGDEFENFHKVLDIIPVMSMDRISEDPFRAEPRSSRSSGLSINKNRSKSHHIKYSASISDPVHLIVALDTLN